MANHMTQQKLLISAASITADLAQVRHIARGISLGVMNAKAISMRAGDSARGFKPITDFIDQMAQHIVRLVADITRHSIELSRLSVKMNTIDKSLEKYHIVISNLGKDDVENRQQIDVVLKRIRHDEDIYRDAFLKKLKLLTLILEEIYEHTRAAQAISASSRVEASQSKSFRTNLLVVADELQNSAEKIKSYLSRSFNQVSMIRQIMMRGVAR